MSGNIELYVRRRDTPNDDRRSGTIATAPARITINGIKLEALLEAVEGDGPVVIEIDELGTKHEEPPTRVLRNVAEQLGREGKRATREDAERRLEQKATAARPKPKSKTKTKRKRA